MVSGNARFHLTTSRSQRLTTFLNASAPFPEPAPVTLSCDSPHVKAVKDVTDLGPLVCCVVKDVFYHRPGDRHHVLFSQQAEIVTKVVIEKMFHRSTPLRPALKSCRTESLHVHQELHRLTHAIELLRECSYCFDQSCLRSDVARRFHRRRRCGRSPQSLILVPAEW